MKLQLAVLKTPFSCPLISQVSELPKYSASQLLRHLCPSLHALNLHWSQRKGQIERKALQASGGKHHLRAGLGQAFSGMLTETQQEFSEIQFSYQVREELIFAWLPSLVCVWPHWASRAPDLMSGERDRYLKWRSGFPVGAILLKEGKLE